MTAMSGLALNAMPPMGMYGGDITTASMSDLLGVGGMPVSPTDLYKALTAGHDTAALGADPSGYALRPESLDASFHLQTYLESYAKFWLKIPKDRAYSTVEEYNRLNSYGDEALVPFASEGELPPAEDSQWSRELEKVKFMGSTRVVSDVLRTVRTAHGDPVQREIQNGFRWIIRSINRALYFADEAIVPIEFNGLEKQIVSGAGATHVIDMRSATNNGVGTALTSDDIDSAAELIFGLGAFGQLTDMFYSTKAHRAFAREIVGAAGANVRFEPHENQGRVIDAGFSMNQFTSNFGRINLHPDVFLGASGYVIGTLTGTFARGDAALRPGTPTIGAPVVAAASGGLWGTATGNYQYTAVALNASGNSAAPAAVTAAVATAADSVTLTITHGAGGAPTGFAIYRTTAGGTTFFEIQRTAAAAVSPTTYVDTNPFIAGTSKAFAFTLIPDVLQWKQLLPMTRVPLAKIDLRERFALTLWGTPILYSPFKAIMWKNILDA